jgi:signal transduction histidine kinase
VRGDGGRLEQALQNLAANALRYAPSGSGIELRARRIERTAGTDHRTDGIALTVGDEGPGIVPEHLPRLFDRFYKAEPSRAANIGGSDAAAGTGAGGSGLGLSIVKAIAERHGGQVNVRSRPGDTVFELLLPDGSTPAT